MNEIRSRTESKTETVIEESDDGHGNIVQTESTVTNIYLYITVGHKTAEEMADKYHFNANSLRSCLTRKTIPCGVPSFMALVQGDGEIVTVALSQVGNVGGQLYWSWYDLGGSAEWCACFVS